MYSKKKVALIVLVTFVITSALYVGTFTLVPAAHRIAQDVKNSFSKNSTTAKLEEIKSYIDNSFIYDLDQEKLDDLSAKGYVAALGDKYSEYLTKDDVEVMMKELTGDYKGIGIEVFVDTDGLITINNVFEDAPAYRAGIKSLDKIISVNGTNVNHENYDEAIKMMTGKGKYKDITDLKLKIKRADEILEVDLTREKIIAKTVFYKMLPNKIGYIRISQFEDQSPEEFNQKLKQLTDDKAKSLIIDLRNNPGGTLPSVVTIADRLLPKCTIFSVQGKNGDTTVYKSNDKEKLDMPMCVLINGNTASAAEVLSSALHDNKKATLIGEKSYGKGVVQTIFSLSDGSALKITTARYLTANGNNIDKKGISPDVEVKAENGFIQIDTNYQNDVQLTKAIEILNK